MSLAVALPDHPNPPSPPASYAELAQSLLLRRPDLFVHPGGGARLTIPRRDPLVQSMSRDATGSRPRRRGGRQLTLPLDPRRPAMLPR